MDQYSSFSFSRYLDEYYAELDAENRFLLDTQYEIYSNKIPPSSLMFDIGGGPTIFQLICASSKVKLIVFAEYLPSNRLHVLKWRESPIWDQYFEHIARRDSRDIADLKKELQEHLICIVPIDLKKSNLGGSLVGQADIVSSSFCFEGISRHPHRTKIYFDRLVKLVKPGGYLIANVVTQCSSYTVGNDSFPATYLTNEDIKTICYENQLEIKYFASMDADKNRGYGGITVFAAQKTRVN